MHETFYTSGLGHLREFFGAVRVQAGEGLGAGLKHDARQVDDGIGILDFTDQRFGIGQVCRLKDDLSNVAGCFEVEGGIGVAGNDPNRISGGG